MNLAPMAAHGGLMPVAFERTVIIGEVPHVDVDDIGSALPGSKNVLLLKEDIHFELLSDRFQSADLGLRSSLFSAGDAVLLFGVVAAAFQVIWLNVAPARSSVATDEPPAPGA